MIDIVQKSINTENCNYKFNQNLFLFIKCSPSTFDDYKLLQIAVICSLFNALQF